jgi:hypothetical protein
VAVTSVGGNTRVTITLSQPCVVRTPHWAFIACDTGAASFAAGMTVVSNTQFYFDFVGTLNPAVNFIQPPFQDPQVQNSQGGFVVPGAKWFRVPVIN